MSASEAVQLQSLAVQKSQANRNMSASEAVQLQSLAVQKSQANRNCRTPRPGWDVA